MTRTIAVFTGTRADYGLLRRLSIAIHADARAELALIVTGSHLSEVHGETHEEIRADGLPFAATIPVWSGDDSAVGAARDVGVAISRYAETLEALAPDVVAVLGDRLEAFAMATAATILGVPIAHIHGGEITEGAMDDALRHAITKMSWLHFTSTAEHRDRVIQMGEEPDRVHFLGAPIVDVISNLKLLSRDELRSQYKIRMDDPTALVTFHPASMDVLPASEVLEELLAGLVGVQNLRVIVTGSNTDIGSTAIRTRIASWVHEHAERADYVESFGQHGYLSAIAQSAVVVGNSSSVVLEAPVLGTPSVLVGDRQKGRPIAPSVRVPKVQRDQISSAIREAIDGQHLDQDDGIFGTAGFAARALDVLLNADLSQPPRKAFHTVEIGERS